jgi:hypothetical protein
VIFFFLIILGLVSQKLGQQLIPTPFGISGMLPLLSLLWPEKTGHCLFCPEKTGIKL